MLNFISELLPLVTFFALYKFFNIGIATIGVMITTVITTSINFIITRKISYVSIFTLVTVMILGGITMISGDTSFIKMKPTVINVIFSLILMLGVIFKKGLLEYILGHSIKMSKKNWLIFSKRWALFFLFLGILNEFVWRNFSENFWVNFKVFGILGLTFCFLMTQMNFLQINNVTSSKLDK